MYNAEKQLIKALPKMVKMAKNSRLKQGFENHLRETESHAQRVEMACGTLGIKPSGMVCRAMKGLIEEASEHMKGLKPGSTTDAELIALAQKVEHYEIGSYGTLCRWAETMGHTEALDLLKKNLSDEDRTDQLLTQIAESEVNQMAAHDSKNMKVRATGTRGGRRTTATAKKARATGTRAGTGRPKTRATAGTPAKAATRSTGRSKVVTTRGRSASAKPKARGRASAR